MKDKKTPPAAPHSDPIAQIIFNYKDEAENAKRNRMLSNRENYDVYHLRQDFSHKKSGQSQEFIAKQANAVEQITSFLQQGLMDQGPWFRVEKEAGVDNPVIDPEVIQKLLVRQLDKNKFPFLLADYIKSGLLGSLMIAKVGGKFVTKSTYKAEEKAGFLGWGRGSKTLKRTDKEIWQLQLSDVRQEDFFPDPTGDGLYNLERIEMDYHQLEKIARDNPNDFDMDAVLKVNAYLDDLQKSKQASETGQNVTMSSYRKRVTIYECWGGFVEQGTGKLLHENSVAAIAIDGSVIRPVKKNPFWHGMDPYVVSPIIRVPKSVWHKALMDAATKHNIALNEIYNLMLDAGLQSVFGVRQIRTDWLVDPNQVSDGVPPAATLRVNSSCPPGAKVLERVDTSALSQDALQLYNLTDREYMTSSLTNDTRMGNLPQRQTKATEIVASNQAITGVFNGIVKMVEEEFVAKILDKSALTQAQHLNDLSEPETQALVGPERARKLALMAPEEIFAAIAAGHSYKVFGLSMTLNKIQDFRKIQALLQSIGTSPQMMQEFQKKYSMTKLFGEIVKSLDIDEDKIRSSPEEQQQVQQQQQEEFKKQMALASAKGGGQKEKPGDNQQSQIPQVGARGAESGIGPDMAAMAQGMSTP